MAEEASTLASFSRAGVILEMIISMEPLKVAKTPCRPASIPKTAAAEMLNLSMMPTLTSIAG